MVYLMLASGFEEVEAVTPVDLLRRAGIPVLTVGVTGKTVSGSHGISVEADLVPEQMDLTRMEMVVLPGGLKGVANLKESPAVRDAVTFAWENRKWIGAICAAPTLLAQLHITDGKKTTCYPGCETQMAAAEPQEGKAVVQDGTVITGTSAGCAIPFALALIEALRGKETADRIAGQIVLR